MGVDGPAREGGAPRADFVHLHVHSEYSLLDGAAQLEKIERAPGQGRKEVDVGLIARAAQLGFPALALTDHGNLFGAIDFYAACQQAAITPDIASYANGHTGGPMPLAVTAYKAGIFDAHDAKDLHKSFDHSSSNTAKPIAWPAGVANLDIWKE